MRRALIVGCSAYDDSNIADLSFAHLDAMRFRATMHDHCGLAESDITVLADYEDADRRPTRDEVVHVLASLVEEPQVDIVHFFFSGHGFHSTETGDDYLLLKGSRASAPEVTSLRFGDVVSLIRAAEPGQFVLYLDACREIVEGKGIAALPTIDTAGLKQRGAVTFCSCGNGELSYEHSDVQSGLFTSVLCDALSDAGRCVTVGEVDEFLRRETPALARRLGRRPQKPETAVDPLQLQHVELVAPDVRNERRASTTIGAEIRSKAVSPLAVAVPDDPLLAIDYGTSFSLVAVSDNGGEIRFIPASDGRVLVPSVIAAYPDGDYVVGAAAVEEETRAGAATVRNAKRHIGTSGVYSLGGRSATPEFASSLIIRSLRQNAEEALGTYARRCLTAYPANFGLAQANALLNAFTLAGLDVFRMVGEPNVASVLVSLDRPDWEGTFLVVDLGGGTFDVAVVEYGENVCQIRAVAGDNELGGIDYDEALAREAQRRLLTQFPLPVVSDSIRRILLVEAQRAKHLLTTAERAAFTVELEHEARLVTFDWEVTRDDFRMLTYHLNRRVCDVVEDVLADSWLYEGIDTIFLTGQGTKIFTIPEVLTSLGLTHDVVGTYREDAVARGLATYTKVLTRKSDQVLLLDLSHRGIGLRLALADGNGGDAASIPSRRYGEQRQLRAHKDSAGGADTVTLVERLTTIPTRRSEIFTFEGDAEADIVFTLIERSKTSAKDVPVGVIRLAAPGESVQLEIDIDVDANSAMMLRIFDHDRRIVSFFQINQFYRLPSAMTLEARTDMLLRGWAIHAVARILPHQMNSVLEHGLERLETIDIDQYVGELVANRGKFLSAAESYRLRAVDGDAQAASLRQGYTTDAAHSSLVCGRLLIARNRTTDAVNELLTALELAAKSEAWQIYIDALDQVEAIAGRVSSGAEDRLAAQLLAHLPSRTSPPSTTDETTLQRRPVVGGLALDRAVEVLSALKRGREARNLPGRR